MKSHNGFTRIDLTVTLICTAFLILSAGAIGNRGRERAQQLVCGSQLAKWGQAIIMHAQDNDGRIMFMPRRWSEEPYPHYMGQADYDDSYGAQPGEWNVFEINPYIGAFSETYDPFSEPQDCGITRLIACPCTDVDFNVLWNVMNCEWQWDFIEPGYSYWVIGGMPDPVNPGHDCSAHVLQDLTLDTLSADRLVMSDIMAIDNTGWESPYRYNHGINGWSWFTYEPGHGDNDPYPKATGRNQVFGDGHFEWRAIPPEYENNLPNSQDAGFCEDRWNGPGSGWVNPGDTSWY